MTTYPYVLLAAAASRTVRRGRGQLGSRGASPALVRDVVRYPPLRLPRGRARVRPPARRRLRLRLRPRRPPLLGRPLRRRRSALLLVLRIAQPVLTSARHRLRVANVVPEAPGVVSIYLTGRDLDRLPVRAGQYLTRPAPDGRRLVPGAPVLAVGGPERPVPAVHREGPRRLVAPAPGRAGRDPGLHRGSVRCPHGRPADAPEGPLRRRRRRDRAAPRDARGVPGRAGRPGPRLPRPARGTTSSSARSSTTSPQARGASSIYVVGRRGVDGASRPIPRPRDARGPRPRRRPTATPTSADPRRSWRRRGQPPVARRRPTPGSTSRTSRTERARARSHVMFLKARRHRRGLTAGALVLLLSFRTPDAPVSTARATQAIAGAGARGHPGARGRDGPRRSRDCAAYDHVRARRGDTPPRGDHRDAPAATPAPQATEAPTARRCRQRGRAVPSSATPSASGGGTSRSRSPSRTADHRRHDPADPDGRPALARSTRTPSLTSGESALQSQSAAIDYVSGATFTSQAYARVAPVGARPGQLAGDGVASVTRRILDAGGPIVTSVLWSPTLESRPDRPAAPSGSTASWAPSSRSTSATRRRPGGGRCGDGVPPRRGPRFSPYRPESEVGRLIRGELDEAACAEDLRHLLALGEDLRRTSDGCFDLRGHRPDGALTRRASSRAGPPRRPPGSSTGPGPAFVVAAGGDVVTRGEPEPGVPWRVGIRHPQQADRVALVLGFAAVRRDLGRLRAG